MTNRVYISGNVKDEMRIKQIRNLIWTRTKAHEFYKKKHPHVTLVPRFSVKDKNLEEVKSIVDQTSFEGEELEVTSLCMYENIHEPYVVELNLRHDMESKIDSLVKQVDSCVSSSVNYPNSLHITLFKTQGWWDDIPVRLKKKLQDEIGHINMEKTQISDVRVDVK